VGSEAYIVKVCDKTSSDPLQSCHYEQRTKNNFQGLITKVKIITDALTDEQIFDLYSEDKDRYQKQDITPILEQSDDVDIIVSPDQITVGGILSHIRKGDTMKVHSLQHGEAEAIEVVVHGDKNTSKVVGSMIKDLPLPEGVVVGAIVRDNELLMGSKKLVIEQGDHVLMMLTDVGKIHQVESLFSENE